MNVLATSTAGTTPIDWANWLTALGTVALAVFGGIALFVESRRYRFSQSIDLILKFDDRFNSVEFRKIRDCAAKCLKHKSYEHPKSPAKEDADEVLDFFETIAYLSKKGALDEEMVWHTFYHWIMGYYQAAEDYIATKRKAEPTVWGDYVNLAEAMKAREPYQVSTEHFLAGEIDGTKNHEHKK